MDSHHLRIITHYALAIGQAEKDAFKDYEQ